MSAILAIPFFRCDQLFAKGCRDFKKKTFDFWRRAARACVAPCWNTRQSIAGERPGWCRGGKTEWCGREGSLEFLRNVGLLDPFWRGLGQVYFDGTEKVEPEGQEEVLAFLRARLCEVRAWVALSEAAWDPVNSMLGNIPHLRVLAYVPAEAIRAAVTAARVPVPAVGNVGEEGYIPPSSRELTAVEGTQVGIMYQVAQLKLGRTPVDPMTPIPQVSTAVGPGGTPPPAAQPASLPGAARKVKNNQVLDQTDEAEIPELGQADIDLHFKALKRIKGGPVRPEAEPSPDQISAMKVRVLQLNMAPYADFGIFVSHQRRFSKTLKFLNHLLQPDGSFRAVEVPGPPSYDDWESSWQVFANTLLTLEVKLDQDMVPVVSLSALDEYKDAFRDLVRNYGESWHLCVTAEDRCRSEHFARLRRELEEKYQKGLAPSFEPARPWDEVFRTAARDREYWDRHVREPALLFRTSGKRKEQPGGTGSLTDRARDSPAKKTRPSQKERLKRQLAKLKGQGDLTGQMTPKGGKGGEKGRGQKRDGKGRYLTDKQGRPICFGYNNGECQASETEGAEILPGAGEVSKGAEPEGPQDELTVGYFRTGRYLNKLTRDELGQPKQEQEDPTSKREEKEIEDEKCIGGMRNPRKAVARLPGWQVWGERASAAIDRVIADMPEATAIVERIRDGMSSAQAETAQARLVQLGERTAAALAGITGTKDWDSVGPTSWRWRLMYDIGKAVGDPDEDVPTWFGLGTPLGIGEPIIARGVYPQAPPTKAQQESAEYLAQLGDRAEIDRNYASFQEHAQESAAELDRLLQEGHIERIGSWEQVKRSWPRARATKLATLVKARPDGSTKTRFIADMLRSGVNGMSVSGERIVLPRGCDLVRDVLDIQELGHGAIELFTADFVDAFLNLPIAQGERGFAIIKLSDGQYASYRGVPFGLASAPLLWGRAAAWIARATQAVQRPETFRLQVYVDDPVAAVCGSRTDRTWLIARTMALWAALGARVALHKAGIGRCIKWIGATYEVIAGGVRVAVDKERIEKLRTTVQAGLQSSNLVQGVRSLAGELSWVAGIVPTIRPFVNMLWAAVYGMDAQQERAKTGASKARARPEGAVFAKTIRTPLQWLAKFLEGQHGGLSRTRLLVDRWARPQWIIRTDASTTGLGGILLDARNQPVRWLATPIPGWALEALDIATGEPGLMTIYELLALLLSMHVWQHYLRRCRIGVLVQLDNEAAIRIAVKMASPHQKANRIAAEIALLLEEVGAEAISGQHWRNEINVEADALSRLEEGKTVPARLQVLPREPLPTTSILKMGPLSEPRLALQRGLEGV
eukprot:s216_g22.t1